MSPPGSKKWATQDTLLSPGDTHHRLVAATLQPKVATLQRKAATLQRKADILQHKVASHQRKVATHQQQAASLQQQEVTPHREADTQTRPVVVTLPRQVVIPQQPGATLPRPVVTLPKLEASLLKQEDTSSLSLEQEAIPPCLQQVSHLNLHPKNIYGFVLKMNWDLNVMSIFSLQAVEAGVQHRVAMERFVNSFLIPHRCPHW